MQLGQIVTILPRSHPGINSYGGAAFITRIHTDANDENSGKPTKIDVKYVLGGRESGIELTYVREEAPASTATKDRRERKQDVKMNVGEWGGGKKKRVALGDVDGNCGSRKRGKKEGDNHNNQKKKKASMANAESSGNEENGRLPDGCVRDGEWMFIKSGRISSYLPYLTATTPIQYWWNDEDGWLHATILKSIYKVVTSKIIKWVVKVEFEDGDQCSLAFHPGDRRWKVKIGGAVDKRKEQAEKHVDKGGMASDKKSIKSAVNPPSKLKNDEKNPRNKSSANAGGGVRDSVEFSAKANTSGGGGDAVKKSKPTDLGLFVKKDSAEASGSGSGTANVSKPADLCLLTKNGGAKASNNSLTVNMCEPTDLGLLTKSVSTNASSGSGTVTTSKPTDLGFLTKNVSTKTRRSRNVATTSKPSDLGILTKNVSTTASSSRDTATTSKPTDLGLLTKNVSTKARSSSGTAETRNTTDMGLLTKNVSTKARTSSDTVTMSKPTDMGLLTKNVSTKARSSSDTVTTSNPTDMGLLTTIVSTKARSSSDTLTTSKPTDMGLLTTNVSTKARSSSDTLTTSKPTDMGLLTTNVSTKSRSSVGTATTSKPTDMGLLTTNVSTKSRSSFGTVTTSKPTDMGLLTTNVSTKARSSGDGTTKKSKPISTTMDAHSTAFIKNTNSDTSTSTKTKRIGNEYSTAFAKKKEPVPIIYNVYKSDKSTVNTVTPSHHATQKSATTANKGASFSFPSNTQSKLKQVASKMAKETEESNATSLAERIDGLEAARLMAASKKKSQRPSSTVDLTTKPAGEKKSEAKAIPKETSANRSRPMTLTETLYEKESTKAEEFVNHMKRRHEMATSTTKPSGTSSGESVSSSASGELVVKVDRQRKELFTTGVYEVMTRFHIEKMDVEELTTKLNAYSSSQKQEPFTPLEARAYLRQLDSQNNIFMVWDEGTSGVVYRF